MTTSIDLATLTIADLRKMPALGAFWDTLGWVHFRLGNKEKAEKYLNAAWKLTQTPVTGDHLGRFYEGIGNKQKAIDFYALTLAVNHAPEETRGRLEALLKSKTLADDAVRTALGELGQQRTARLPRIAKGPASAEFFVLFDADSKTAGVKFVSGSENLRGATQALSTAFDIDFPDDGQDFKLVRRGILDCPVAGASCQFVLLLPNSVQDLN
jgi:tetratricopeptide (TPR) repeat protein